MMLTSTGGVNSGAGRGVVVASGGCCSGVGGDCLVEEAEIRQRSRLPCPTNAWFGRVTTARRSSFAVVFVVVVFGGGGRGGGGGGSLGSLLTFEFDLNVVREPSPRDE